MGYLAKRFRMRLPIIVMLIPFFTLFVIFTVYPVVRFHLVFLYLL